MVCGVWCVVFGVWGGWGGGGGGGGGPDCVLHEGVCPATRTLAPNSGGRTPGSGNSRRPRHTFPALMAGVNPGPVLVHKALQAHPSSQPTSLHDHRDVKNNR